MSRPVPAFPLLSLSASLRVAPPTIEEASEVMKLATSERWTVMPAGAATWLRVQAGEQPPNLIVSTERMNHILDHEPADLVAGAQAGVTLNNFNEALAQGGQWLPLDPPNDGNATIGGVVATGLAGPLQAGFGSPRNFVIGMRVVLADGRIVKTGGRVVKNVAGYDLCKLFTGSVGSLGLIAELTFKLRPHPAKEVTLVARGTFASIHRAAWEIYRTPLFPVALEILSASMAKRVGLEVQQDQVVLLARFAGIEKTVDYQIEQATTILKNKSASDLVIGVNEQQLWRRLAVAGARDAEKPDELIVRIQLKPSQVGDFMTGLAEVHPPDGSLAWQTGVSEGRVRMIARAEAAQDQFAEWSAAAQRLDASLVIENGPVAFINRTALKVGAAARQLAKRIKQQLDPDNIFSASVACD